RPPPPVLVALAERLASDPDGPYLDFSGGAGDSVKLTAREMDRESNGLAHTLREMGVEHGDRVATLLDNRAEQVISFFAALKLGAVQVPINTAYKGEFLRHQLADSGAKGFLLPHNYIVSLADQIARAWQRRADDVVITPLPLFHFNAISVCVVGTLVVGGHSAIERRFSVSNFWPEVKRTGATMVSMLGS